MRALMNVLKIYNTFNLLVILWGGHDLVLRINYHESLFLLSWWRQIREKVGIILYHPGNNKVYIKIFFDSNDIFDSFVLVIFIKCYLLTEVLANLLVKNII